MQVSFLKTLQDDSQSLLGINPSGFSPQEATGMFELELGYVNSSNYTTKPGPAPWGLRFKVFSEHSLEWAQNSDHSKRTLIFYETADCLLPEGSSGKHVKSNTIDKNAALSLPLWQSSFLPSWLGRSQHTTVFHTHRQGPVERPKVKREARQEQSTSTPAWQGIKPCVLASQAA